VARRLLVAADVALAVVLLTSAGLMIRSVSRLVGVDPGFTPDGVLTMQLAFVGPAYGDNRSIVASSDLMLARIRALPGVHAVAAAGQIPLSGNGDRWGMHVQGSRSNPAEDPSVERYSVTPEYFSLMGIPLLRGRLLSDADRASSEPVIVIGDRTARTIWPAGNAIGEHVRIGDPTSGPWRTIVGIVGDVRHRDLAAPPTPQMYVPQAQLPDSYLTVVIRAGGDPSRQAAATRLAISTVDATVPVSEVAPLTDLVARAIGPRRFVMTLLEAFAAIALVLTAVGVYGVLSSLIGERTREIGIRAALGASRFDILRLVAGAGLGIFTAGLAAGIIASLGATRYLHASLYGVSATDPATLAGAALVLLVVAAVAHILPVLRATRIDPAAALRMD
jgi:predicted permease